MIPSVIQAEHKIMRMNAPLVAILICAALLLSPASAQNQSWTAQSYPHTFLFPDDSRAGPFEHGADGNFRYNGKTLFKTSAQPSTGIGVFESPGRMFAVLIGANGADGQFHSAVVSLEDKEVFLPGMIEDSGCTPLMKVAWAPVGNKVVLPCMRWNSDRSDVVHSAMLLDLDSRSLRILSPPEHEYPESIASAYDFKYWLPDLNSAKTIGPSISLRFRYFDTGMSFKSPETPAAGARPDPEYSKTYQFPISSFEASGPPPSTGYSSARQAVTQEILESYDYDSTHIGRVANHADYAYMSWAVYGSEEADSYLNERGWKQHGDTVSIDTLSAGNVVYRVYHKDSYLVVAFRGTATGGDWVTNLTSPSILPSEQAAIAGNVAEQLANHFGSRFYLQFTGHSLGGRLAMVSSAKTNKEAIVFNSAPLSSAEWLSIKSPNSSQNLNATGYRSPDDILEPLNISADYYTDYEVANIVAGPSIDWNFSHDIGILARAMGEVSYALQQGWLSSALLEKTCRAQPDIALNCPYEERDTCVGSGCYSQNGRARTKANLTALSQPKGGVELFQVKDGQDLEVLTSRAYSVPCAGDYAGNSYDSATRSLRPVTMRNVYRLSYFGEGTFRYLDGSEVKSGDLGWAFSPHAPELCSDISETWAQVRTADGKTGWVLAETRDHSTGFVSFFSNNFFGLSRHDVPPDEYPTPAPLPNPVGSRAVELVNLVIDASPAEREAMVAATDLILTNLKTGPLAERLTEFGLTPTTVSAIIETKLSDAIRESARDLTVGVFWQLLTEFVADGFATILMDSEFASNLPESLKSPMRALLHATMSEAMGLAKTATIDAGTVGPLAVVFPVLDRIQDARDIYEASHAVSEARNGALLAVAVGAEINAELIAKHRGERTDAIVERWETDTLNNLRSIATDEDYLELREIFTHGFQGLKWQKLGYTRDSGEIEVRALLGFRNLSGRATNSGWDLLDGLIKIVSGDNPRAVLIDGFLTSTSLSDLSPTIEATLGDWKDVPAPHIKLKHGESYQDIRFTEDGQAFVSGQPLETSWNTRDTEIHLYFSPSRAFTFLVMRDWDKGGYVAGIRSQYQPFKRLDVFPPNYSDRDESKHCSFLHDGVAWSPENGLIAFMCIQREASAELGIFRLRDGRYFLHRPRWAERTIGDGQPIDGGRWISWGPDFRTLAKNSNGDLSVVF
ncbi:MAG: hypothetical protein VXW22_03650, partial [Pseudomonadota bacterium]|nr:hypothetical protein [Pseudomonadota bacterium]